MSNAVLLNADKDGIAESGRRLCAGSLVAFPTETVYGLGANACLEPAVRNIFAVKGRPLTDPLIVHVSSLEAALEQVVLEDPQERAVFVALGTRFWPGGLTLIAPMAAHLPLCLTAGTGKVGVRVPNHPVALALLRACNVPVAAPSANRFGHVSPTSAAHVLADLGWSRDVAVLNGDNLIPAHDSSSAEGNIGADGNGSASHAASDSSSSQPLSGHDSTAVNATCYHGIESTVCRIDVAHGELIVYRRGAISEAALQAALDQEHAAATVATMLGDAEASTGASVHAVGAGAAAFPALKVRIQTKLVPMPAGFSHGVKGASSVAAADTSAGAATMPEAGAGASANAAVEARETEATGEEAPGQLVTHYAPDLPTYIVRVEDSGHSTHADANTDGDAETEAAEAALAKSVVIDFGGSLAWLQGDGIAGLESSESNSSSAHRRMASNLNNSCLAYLDLSPSGDAAVAGRALFAALRWAELVKGAARVLLPDIEHVAASIVAAAQRQSSDASVSSTTNESTLRETGLEHAASVADRAFRAASGRVMHVALGKVPPAFLA